MYIWESLKNIKKQAVPKTPLSIQRITVHIDRQRHRMQQSGKNMTWHKSLSASERASNEQIRPLSAAHGAQSDKDTLQTGNQGPSKQEAHTNGPTKCDRGLNCAHAPPPPPTPPHCLLRRRDMDKPYPPRGEGRKGRGSACRDTPRERRAGCYAKGRDMCADVCGLNDGCWAGAYDPDFRW